jgi:hypothetical protein
MILTRDQDGLGSQGMASVMIQLASELEVQVTGTASHTVTVATACQRHGHSASDMVPASLIRSDSDSPSLAAAA